MPAVRASMVLQANLLNEGADKKLSENLPSYFDCIKKWMSEVSSFIL